MNAIFQWKLESVMLNVSIYCINIQRFKCGAPCSRNSEIPVTSFLQFPNFSSEYFNANDSRFVVDVEFVGVFRNTFSNAAVIFHAKSNIFANMDNIHFAKSSARPIDWMNKGIDGILRSNRIQRWFVRRPIFATATISVVYSVFYRL